VVAGLELILLCSTIIKILVYCSLFTSQNFLHIVVEINWYITNIYYYCKRNEQTKKFVLYSAEMGAQIKNFNAQSQIAQPKFLICKTQAQIAQVKNKIGKAQAQIVQVKNKIGKAQAQIAQLYLKI